jgi:flagellar biosynthesis/type III secretory pathway protein FliH
MNTNKSTKRTIKGLGIGLALLFSFMLLPGIDVNAQIIRQDRRQDRREDRQDRRQDRRDDRRDARQDGYEDGLREGAEDARARRRSNAQAESDYRRAGGENNPRERQAYRTGFLLGYREGYNRNIRSNRNRRGY